MSTLFIVGTPIGNLEDISQRALAVLAQADLIAAEDTRITRRLLGRYQIATPLVTFTDAYDRSKAARQLRVLDALAAGQDVALVSDAGMPGLSDPGYELIQAALQAGHQLLVVPGPSAITAALVASGLPAVPFHFVGFLPRKRSTRRALLEEVAGLTGTLVAFEAPHRLQASLADLLEVLGDRPVAVARELTKRHEEVWRGNVSGAVDRFSQEPPRGEITLVLGGHSQPDAEGSWTRAQVLQAVTLLQKEGLAPAAVARVVSRLASWQRSAVYDLAAGKDRANEGAT